MLAAVQNYFYIRIDETNKYLPFGAGMLELSMKNA